MSEVRELSDVEKAYLEPYLPGSRYAADGRRQHASTESVPRSEGLHDAQDQSLPFVTLTYAQSMDSMISLAPGQRTTLSGPETKSMTHYLRMHYDAVLIGVGTAIPDDPGLNCRYPGATLDSQPTPIIVDPKRRWNVYDSKVLRLAEDGEGMAPWLIHTHGDLDAEELHRLGGGRIVVAPVSPGQSGLRGASGSGSIAWITILKALKRKGINSVMIEGGATVISTLLSMPELVNSVIVTIAPTWLGQGGVAVAPSSTIQHGDRVNAARLKDTAWRQFGADAVLCGRLQK